MLLRDALLLPPPLLLCRRVGVHVRGQVEVAGEVAAEVPYLHVEEREGDDPEGVEMSVNRGFDDLSQFDNFLAYKIEPNIASN